jgi:hypothetical protein
VYVEQLRMTDYYLRVLVLCLGYNWLHNVGEEESAEEELKDVPSGRRVWTWLILCYDGMTPRL